MAKRSLRILLAVVVAITTLVAPSEPALADPLIPVSTDQIFAGVYPPGQWYAADHILALNEAVGKKVSIGGIWFDVADTPSNVIYTLEQVWSAEATPFVNIHVEATAAEVASGSLDSQIASLGAAISQWIELGEGRSVLLAPMPEMNGDWIPYGKTPTAFREAFRRFVSVTSQSVASPSLIRWVFAPNGWSAPPYQMGDYYPGADVVDFVGLSAYNWGSALVGGTWNSVEETMGGSLDEARGFAPEKPFLLAQTASSSFGGDKDGWITDMFEYLANDPNVVGFIYFNIEKEQDWAMYKLGDVLPGWRDGMDLQSTGYQWPISDWFVSGTLIVENYLLEYQGTFIDDDTSPFEVDIEWLVQSSITLGCGEYEFCPARKVSRGEMATFLSRALFLPPPIADYFFDDSGSPHEWSANQVKEAGIANGCSDTAFCTNSPTTREEMASFLVRALHLPATTIDYFTDDEGSVHEAAINALREADITSGCTATSFCPTTAVSREQMAAFLRRALDPASG